MEYIKKTWLAVDEYGSRFLRHPIGIYLITGLVAAGITLDVFTTKPEQTVVIAGFLFTIWALMLTTMVYRFSTLDTKKSVEVQAKANDLLTETLVLAKESQTDVKQLLAKVERLEAQLEELTRSPQFHGQYENKRHIPRDHLVTKRCAGDNYVVSLYGRPRFLLTKLSPYSAGDLPIDISLSQIGNEASSEARQLAWPAISAGKALRDLLTERWASRRLKPRKLTIST